MTKTQGFLNRPHHTAFLCFSALGFFLLLLIILPDPCTGADEDFYSNEISNSVKVEVYAGDEDYSVTVKVLDDFDKTGSFTASDGNLTAAVILSDGNKEMTVIDEGFWNSSSSITLDAVEAGNYTVYGGVENEGTTYFARMDFEVSDPVPNAIPLALPFMFIDDQRYDPGEDHEVQISEKGYYDIVFNGSQSYDLDEEDNDTLEFIWTIFYTQENYTVRRGETILHRFWDPGFYSIRLRVSDGKDFNGGGVAYLNFTIKGSYKPDLQFETAPNFQRSDYEVGDEFAFSFRVVNKGLVGSSHFNVSTFFYRQGTGGSIPAVVSPIPGLASFAASLVQISIDTTGYQAGNYFLELRIDLEEMVGEMNETNNELGRDNFTLFIIPDPMVELALANITLEKDINQEISVDDEIAILSPVTFTITVENTGTSTAFWPQLRFYVDDTRTDTQQLDDVPAGSVRQARFVWYTDTNGSWPVRFELPHQGELVDSVELELFVVSMDPPPEVPKEEVGFWAESSLDEIVLWGGGAAILLALVMVGLSKYSEEHLKQYKVEPEKLPEEKKPGVEKTGPSQEEEAEGATPQKVDEQVKKEEKPKS